METAAQALLAGFAAVLVIHYLDGGPQQVKTYANYVFTGRGPDGNGAPDPNVGELAADALQIVPSGNRPKPSRPSSTVTRPHTDGSA